MLTREAFHEPKEIIGALLTPFEKNFPEVLSGLNLIVFDETQPAWAYGVLRDHLQSYSEICKKRCEWLLTFSVFSPIFLYTNYDVALSLAYEKHREITQVVENPQSVGSQVKPYYW